MESLSSLLKHEIQPSMTSLIIAGVVAVGLSGSAWIIDSWRRMRTAFGEKRRLHGVAYDDRNAQWNTLGVIASLGLLRCHRPQG